MEAHYLRWAFEAGEVHVGEYEHLFGYDVIFSKSYDGATLYPVAIVCRQEPMDVLEQRRARIGAMSLDGGDWASYTACKRSLNGDETSMG
jgi:hypothetical protein